MKKIALNILLGLSVSLFIYSCANQGYPTGGPIDETPPRVTETRPENYALNFKGGKIEIFFNEFVKLENINEKFVVSPPFKKTPTVKLKGRSIYVKLEEELKENTTYTLDFGDGIVDNNEGNPLGEYQFVFSTGETIDSLSIKGKVDNSFDETPVEKSMVMAYLNTHDSVPMTTIPDYIALTDSAGYFQLNNLKEGTYKLFALVDGNRDYLYNGPGEMIGYFDELIVPSAHRFEQLDSIGGDSVVIRQAIALEPNNIHIRMFDEENPLQYLTGYKRPRREKLEFEFNAKRTDSLKIDFIGFEENPDWFLAEINERKDTLSFWITDSTIYQRDTLLAALEYFKTDSTNQLSLFQDTVKLNFKDPKKAKAKQSKKKDKKKVKIKKPQYKFNFKTSTKQDLHKNITISFDEPLARINYDSIHFYQLKDTLEIPVDFKIEKDPKKLLQYNFVYKWEPETSYKIDIDSTAFQNIYGVFSDSFEGKIRTRELEHYGKLFLNVSGVKIPTLVQLLETGKNEKLVQTKKIESDQTVIFDYLEPKTYIIKVIEDENDNGTWDTGNYQEKIQPEQVYYFYKELKVRSNWEVEDKIMIPSSKEVMFEIHEDDLLDKVEEMKEAIDQKVKKKRGKKE
ncbi:Ig-like domain-containing domain [Marinifilum caeruleilacunae]|uniref:Ig-like domain-containing domain n=1 Tax=Marinifilum caeruleilacunae TaxID=2499076 RepID=UPI001492BA9A|nr:Ig-like domain-containing domain [Marinifilum caeruleilacunae]